MHLRHGRFRQRPDLSRKFHFAPALARGVEDGPARHGPPEHFLQAKRLGAELDVVILELAPLALLVFDRDERAIGMPLDDIAFPIEPEPLRPDWERSEKCDTLCDLVSRQIGVHMREIADERVDIGPPQPFDDLQPRPPIAEEEVVEQAEGQRVQGNMR